MNANGLDDGQSAKKADGNEARTLVGFVAQLVCLNMREDEKVQSFSVLAQELYLRILHAGETLTPVKFIAAFLIGLCARYDHFIVREISNALSVNSELRKRLLNYSIESQRLDQSAVLVALPTKSSSKVSRSNVT